MPVQGTSASTVPAAAAGSRLASATTGLTGSFSRRAGAAMRASRRREMSSATTGTPAAAASPRAFVPGAAHTSSTGPSGRVPT